MAVTRNNIVLTLEGGQQRASQHSSWAPYSVTTEVSSFEQASVNHPLRGGVRQGGPWLLTRDKLTKTIANVNNDLVKGRVVIGGPSFSYTGITGYAKLTDNQLDAAGTTGIARTAPTKSVSNLPVDIAEIFADGLPSLPGKAAEAYTRSMRKRAGSEYLNVEFGWKPFISSLQDFAHAVVDSETLINDYVAGANRGIRVATTLSDEQKIGQWYGRFTPSPSNSGGIGFLDGSVTERVFQKTWFEGMFTYYLPLGNGLGDKLSRHASLARKLLGNPLSVETVWNVSPWSWAADWVSNTGDVMAANSALGTDGLVLKYGYVMSHTGKETMMSASNSKCPVVSSRRIVETKVRRAATPYGFGVDLDGLSARQVAILAALGLSRS
jgi:hypothetical protein